MDNLKTLFEPLLEARGVMLYELEWDRSIKPPVLRVVIDRNGEPIDLDICALVSEDVSAALDKADSIDGEYMLEVCSPGAERELRTDTQIASQIGKYVQIALKEEQNAVKDIFGKLDTIDEDGGLHVSTFIKGRPKKYVVSKTNIKHIRSAVKV